ncbi:hypothetical protein GGR56DRAFT_668438 [Xylariaceae sp. FL0804]|nr:hypothetical protein GGR56DRAFT_668438 [Xylariaceae sp. FL0804]
MHFSLCQKMLKLCPFGFQGQQVSDFLVRIFGREYALNLFRCPVQSEDREAMSPFYGYSEPFRRECRAFGRLKEAGHEESAISCYSLTGDMELPGDVDISQAGCSPSEMAVRPIRGIVKDMGSQARKLLRDVVKSQQLGIISVDPAACQLVADEIRDVPKGFRL